MLSRKSSKMEKFLLLIVVIYDQIW